MPAATPTPSPLFALLVGINEYANSVQVPALKGCQNDVEAMAQCLQQRFGAPPGAVRTLLDNEATHKAIKDAFRTHLIAAARRWHEAVRPDPGPAFVFHFSGHGSQAPDPTGTKLNGLDETIVPYDSRTPGVYDLKDWELGQLLEELTRYTENVTVILDCCHSGSGTRDPQPNLVAARRCPTDTRPQPSGRPTTASASRALATASGWMQPDHYVLLAACRDRELANEYRVRQGNDFRFHGVLSYFLLRELGVAASGGRPQTYRELHERVRSEVNRIYDAQMPQCEGDRDRVVFGGIRPRRDPFFTVVYKSAGYIWVDGGLAQQLTKGSLLHAHPPETRTLDDAGQPIATLEVEEAGAVRSACVVREGRPDVPLQARVVLHRLNNGDLQRTVALDGDPTALAPLQARLTREDVAPYVRLKSDGSPAEFRVSLRSDAFEVQDGSGRLLIAPIAVTQLDEVARDLCHLVRYHNALNLHNKAPHSELLGAVGLSVRLLGFDKATQEPQAVPIEPTAGGEVQVGVGQPIVLEVSNHSGSPLYLGVFDFSYDWSITLLHPRHGEEQALNPGKTLSLGLSRKRSEQLAPRLPDDVTEVRQVVKVFASVQPAGYDSLCQGALKVPFASKRTADQTTRSTSPLTRLLELAMQGGQHRALGPPPATAADEWTTYQTEFTLVRGAVENSVSRPLVGGEAAELPGYPLRFEAPAGFQGSVRVLTERQSTRSAEGDVAGSASPPGIAPFPEQFRPLELRPTRAVCPPGCVIEIDAVAPARETVTEKAPLKLRLPSGADRDAEGILAVAFDGSVFYPVGGARGGEEAVTVRWLPPPAPDEEVPLRTTRGLGRTVKLYLFKVLGLPTPSLGLHRALFVREEERTQKPAAAGDRVHPVAGGEVRTRLVTPGECKAGQRVALLVHGFQSDSYWMPADFGRLCQQSGSSYDHVLTFDYESFNTRIRDNAGSLAEALRAAGFSPKDGVQVDVFAHSMGGLVARYLVEVFGGDTFVDRCFLIGVPNQGTVLASAKRLVPWLGTLLLNSTLSSPPGLLASWALKRASDDGVGVDDLCPGSESLRALNAATGEARVRYYCLTGSYQLPNDAKILWRRLWSSFRKGLKASLDFVFDDANDLVVSLTSMQTVREGRYPAELLVRAVVPCSHVAYFSDPQAEQQLASWLRGSPG
jgi:pimeloyl-ACP methyl ester carboxylesterase